MKTVITGLMALVWSLGLHAQVADTAAVAPEVMPIESPELHGAREATEEEKHFFEFFHNPITISRLDLDHEQAYHPSVETVFNLSN